MESDNFAVLLVEDDEAQAFLVGKLLASGEGARIEVTHVTRLAEAFEAMRARTYDAVILDLGLPDAFGLQGVQRLSGRTDEIPVVVLTAASEPAMARAAIKLGAADYILKDRLDGSRLSRTVIFAVERHRARRRRREAELRVRDAVAAMDDGLLVIDQAGQVLFANPAAAAMHGTTAEMMPGELFEHPTGAGPPRLVTVGPRPGRAVRIRCSPMVWRGREAHVIVLRPEPPGS